MGQSRQNSRTASRLLAWYDRNRRVLPWRALPGESPDPYRIWLSEIMLQQTTVAAVAGYYHKFTHRWPNVEALAAASLDEVRAAWAGLGYYARARNLHRAAETVVGEHCGRFPSNAAVLRTLPGVGPYTAGAIAAIAFDAQEAAVDANAERVIARFFAVEEPLPRSKPTLRNLAQSLVPARRAGDFAQALMDLGATVCTQKRPLCSSCPWEKNCGGLAAGIAESLPRKAQRRIRPLRRGAAFVARDQNGAILLVKRPENGLLAGMLQPPLGPWSASFPRAADAVRQAPFRAQWRRCPGVVSHGFTHFELELEVWRAEVMAFCGGIGIWLAPHALATAALPTVMRKVIAHAFTEGDCPISF